MRRRPGPTVLLISMPWAPRNYTPIQLGVLKAALENEGFSCHTENLFLRFAERLGADVYDRISMWFSGVGEWLFSASLSPRERDGYLKFVAEGLESEAAALGDSEATALDDLTPARRKHLERIRTRDVPEFLSAELDRLSRPQYDIVGFTCTVNQLVPSLVFARRWKRRHPKALIVLGGGSVHGEMGEECVRVFPWLDAIVDGEGEITLPELVRFHREHRGGVKSSAVRPRGLILRGRSGPVHTGPREVIADLDRVPTPDYGDYFRSVAEMRRARPASIFVKFETARGCWWGQKSNCVFCGVNGAQLRYRAKSPARVLLEILSLAGSHQASNLYAVDTICGKSFYEQVSPRLRDAGFDLTLFWEVHPALGRAQLESLRDSGVRMIQPGIESFSTKLLRFMRKGTDAIHNIRFLRWCRELGVDAEYNVLWGLPGSFADAYEEMISLLPKLTHLAPPSYPPSRVVFQRFSPLLQQALARGSVLEPQRDYRFLYPSDVDLGKLAYTFEHPIPCGAYEIRRVRALAREVKEWRRRYYSIQRPFLVFKSGPGFVEVCDTRGESAREFVLTGPAAAILEFCADIRSKVTIRHHVEMEFGATYSEGDLDRVLDRLVADALLYHDGSRYLSLPIPRRSLHEELSFAAQARVAGPLIRPRGRRGAKEVEQEP